MKRAAPVLTIPFYQQTLDFTCGPACLIMAMQYFDPRVEATRELEIDIWREANLVECYGTSRFGLALSGWRRGFEVFTWGVEAGLSFVDGLRDRLPNLDRGVLTALYADLKERCESAGIRDRKARPGLRQVRRWVEEGSVPLLLTDSTIFGEESLPHWVVVAGFDGSQVLINNPLSKWGPTALTVERLEEGLGFKGTRCAVVVAGKSSSLRA
ncbi:MAG: peptidase C39 family protein [Thermoplasmata archaeon]